MPNETEERRTAAETEQARSFGSNRWGMAVAVVIPLLGVSLLLAGWQSDTSPPRTPQLGAPAARTADRCDPNGRREEPATSPSTGVSKNHAEASAGKIPPSDERLRRLIVGDWEQNQYGKRTLNVREDGSAAMVVQPDCWWSALFGERLVFDIQWSIDAGRLTFKTTGGKPDGKVELVLQTYGRESCQPILELTAKRLLLLDEDEETKQDWKRVSASTPQ